MIVGVSLTLLMSLSLRGRDDDSTSPKKKERVVLRVLGVEPSNKEVIWVQPMLPPAFAFRVVKGKVPEEHAAIICELEEQGRVRTITNETGQFMVLSCEGGVEMGMARVDFGSR